MGRQLILDTSILVAVEREVVEATALGMPEDDVAIAALTLAEYPARMDFATKPRLTARRMAFLDALRSTVEILAYTEETAVWHTQLLDAADSQGKPRGAHDLIIAAHAAETGRILVTADARADFATLPGVTVEVVSAPLVSGSQNP